MYAVGEGCPVVLDHIRTSKREENGQLKRISRLCASDNMIKILFNFVIYYYKKEPFFCYFKIETK